ncbi:MAG TPA: hypothetical protein VFI31_02900 [Pirellulales bacterium]|nr:hypothetical protein [Pirellulales bacterium]
MASDVRAVSTALAADKTAPLASAPPRPRRWLQFSIRTMLLLTGAAAVLMSVLGVPLFRLRREQLAVERLEESGARLTSEAARGMIAWAAAKFFGPEAAMHVTKVDLAWQPVDDDLALHLGHLEHLTTLNVNGAAITDRGLARLGGCRSLERLEMHGAPITDAGLDHLATLTALEIVDFSNTKITGTNLGPFLHLPALEVLNLNGTPLTDAAQPVLVRMQHLRWLGVSHTRLSEAARDALAAALPTTAIDD